MASLTAFPSLSSSSLCTLNSSYTSYSSPSVSVSFLLHKTRINAAAAAASSTRNYSTHHFSTTNRTPQRFTRIRSVAEETLAPEEEDQPKEAEAEAPVPDQATVSVPVSPSDVLTMFFQAEGTMSDSAVDKVTSALEKVEDVSGLKVEIVEGIASVQLTKQTTVQATGVASNLVEVIQGSGFKLQTLNLSFEDEEDTSA